MARVLAVPQRLVEKKRDGVQGDGQEDRRPREDPDASQRALDEDGQLLEQSQAAEPRDPRSPQQTERPEDREALHRVLLCFHRQGDDHLQNRKHHEHDLEYVPVLIRTEEVDAGRHRKVLDQDFEQENRREGHVDECPTPPLRLQVATDSDHDHVQHDEEPHRRVEDVAGGQPRPAVVDLGQVAGVPQGVSALRQDAVQVGALLIEALLAGPYAGEATEELRADAVHARAADSGARAGAVHAGLGELVGVAGVAVRRGLTFHVLHVCGLQGGRRFDLRGQLRTASCREPVVDLDAPLLLGARLDYGHDLAGERPQPGDLGRQQPVLVQQRRVKALDVVDAVAEGLDVQLRHRGPAGAMAGRGQGRRLLGRGEPLRHQGHAADRAGIHLLGDLLLRNRCRCSTLLFCF
mmetsp:Transcript_64493/g.197311  ORF Transcript_64493/g.197311 Transcript_64493/m.197311 type:complete len:407 (+) Transcript_64493:941-2161(+)